MIKTTLGHIQLNIDAENLPFYKDLFAFVGWKTLHEDATVLGVGSADTSLWFVGNANDAKNDYDGKGMNHLALHVQSQDKVDQMVAYLQEQDIAPLFETPRHRPEFSQDADHTYYQVMFETPDKILLEVVYIGRK
jgi:catechol 2,3-dioxygenase-like lactoylglutathione lyase family enzyme